MCPFFFLSPIYFMAANKFTKHPNSIGETYSQHLLKAFSFGCKLLLLSICCFIHGVFPFLHKHTTLEKLEHLNDILRSRKDQTNVNKN